MCIRDSLSSLQDTYRQYETCLGPAAEYLNIYALRQCKKVYEGQRKSSEEKRVCILSRSGFAGGQAYGATVWSGDSYGTWLVFRQQITAGLNSVSYTHLDVYKRQEQFTR